MINENNVSVRKQPMRRCTGCGERFPKKELIRIVRTPDGEILLDEVGKKSGRGAYICKKVSCLKSARKAKRLESSLDVSIPSEVYNRLEEELTVGKQ